jgi:hypothetical protein
LFYVEVLLRWGASRGRGQRGDQVGEQLVDLLRGGAGNPEQLAQPRHRGERVAGEVEPPDDGRIGGQGEVGDQPVTGLHGDRRLVDFGCAIHADGVSLHIVSDPQSRPWKFD